MKDNNSVSIIIPVFNAEKYLDECLDSIIKQSHKEIEVILIDDGSTDKSSTICMKYKDKNKNIIYERQENKGVSSARNRGIEIATGNYIIFVDSDDIVSKTYITDFLNVTNNLKNSLVCCSFSSNINEINSSDNLSVTKYKNKYDFIYDKAYGYLWNKIYSRKIIKENNIYFKNEVTMCEDILFNLEYVSYCNSTYFFEKKNYFYRLSKSSLTTNLKNEKWFSILIALKEELKYYNDFSINTQKKFVYYARKVILESDYRIANNNSMSVEKKQKIYTNINYLKKIIKEKKEKMFMIDRIKYLLFSFFPNIMFKLNN